MIRKSTAVWRGDALHGSGALTTQSEAFRERSTALSDEVIKACRAFGRLALRGDAADGRKNP